MTQYLPSEFYLAQNYPNPFKEKTVIKYCVAHKTKVKLTVYNSGGEEIKKLVDEEQNPGAYEVEFQPIVENKKPDYNHPELKETNLSYEFYFYQLKAGNYANTKKMVLVK